VREALRIRAHVPGARRGCAVAGSRPADPPLARQSHDAAAPGRRPARRWSDGTLGARSDAPGLSSSALSAPGL